MYSRTALLIGDENVEIIKKSRVLIAGLGGVGGYVFEALARAGVGTLGLCDFDVVDITNKNRQILALDSTVGKPKALVAEERLKDINPDCEGMVFNFKIDESTLDELDIASWDYVADCIDDVDAKTLLIRKSGEENVPIISSMGTGNKLNSDDFKISKINQTEYDRLARSMRRKTKDLGINYEVLYSKESPVQDFIDTVPSISYMPAAAGLRIAEHIIKKLIGVES
jgi:tRNA A37 threonylcarbamoyladenosine dehydratase